MEAYLVSVMVFLQLVAAIESTSFTLTNNCPYTIWPANYPMVSDTDFALGQDGSATIRPPMGWAGRIWARTFCQTNSTGGFVCATGDCGTGEASCKGNIGATPLTLVEFTLNGFGSSDFYDISLIDGFNLPVAISSGGCPAVSCPVDINAVCPSNRTVSLSNGGVVACRSDPSLFKSQCPQAFASPQDNDTFSCSPDSYFISFCPSSGHPQYLGMLCLS